MVAGHLGNDEGWIVLPGLFVCNFEFFGHLQLKFLQIMDGFNLVARP